MLIGLSYSERNGIYWAKKTRMAVFRADGDAAALFAGGRSHKLSLLSRGQPTNTDPTDLRSVCSGSMCCLPCKCTANEFVAAASIAWVRTPKAPPRAPRAPPF